MDLLKDGLVSAVLAICWLHISAVDVDPIVTLKHGGQLQGISYPVGETKVDHFIGKVIVLFSLQRPPFSLAILSCKQTMTCRQDENGSCFSQL